MATIQTVGSSGGLKVGADDGVGQSRASPEGDLAEGGRPWGSDREEPADDGVDPVGQSLSAYQQYRLRLRRDGPLRVTMASVPMTLGAVAEPPVIVAVNASSAPGAGAAVTGKINLFVPATQPGLPSAMVGAAVMPSTGVATPQLAV